MQKTSLTPRTSRHLTPNFHELGWDKFQLLCSDLIYHEAHIKSVDPYGKQGQSQRGIDILAHLESGGVSVFQCKCEQSFNVYKVKKASKEFLKHIDYWKVHGIKEFILCVACDASDRKIQDEALKQKEVFKALDIGYSLWSSAKLHMLIVPHPEILRKYTDIPEEMVSQICGLGELPMLGRQSVASIGQKLEKLSLELEEQYSDRLREIRRKSKQGEHHDALNDLILIKKSDGWSGYSSEFRSQVIRLEVAMRLNLGHPVNTVEQDLMLARETDPKANFDSLDSFVLYKKGDIDGAISLLNSSTHPDARNLYWSLLIESGRLSELEGLLAVFNGDFDADTHRTLALYYLIKKDLPMAQHHSQEASSLEPLWRSVQHVGAIISYYTALSLVADGFGNIAWPIPVEWDFVKRDQASVHQMKESAEIFKRLSDSNSCSDQERELYLIWQLACLSCIENKQEEAQCVLDAILMLNPCSIGALLWAAGRNYDFDVDGTILLLKEATEEDADFINKCLLLYSISINYGRADGFDVVDFIENKLTGSKQMDLWLLHLAQGKAVNGESDVAQIISRIQNKALKEHANLVCLRILAPSSNEYYKAYIECLLNGYNSGGNTQILYELFLAKIEDQDGEFVLDHAEELVANIQTSVSLEVAIRGCMRIGEYALCLKLYDENKDLFSDQAGPPSLRKAIAECRHRLGDWAQAVDDAEKIFRDFPDRDNMLSYFGLLLKCGDLPACVKLAAESIELVDLDPLACITLSKVVRTLDLSLAIKLWKKANERLIRKLNLATESLHLAYLLGIPNEATKLQVYLQKQAKRGRGPMQEKTLEEIKTIIREGETQTKEFDDLYRKGDIPLHVLADTNHIPLTGLYTKYIHSSNQIHGTPPLFVRAGSRPVESMKVGDSIFLDVTTMLIAYEFDFLDSIEREFKTIYISSSLTELLLYELGSISPSQPDRHNSRLSILRMVEGDRIKKIHFNSDFSQLSLISVLKESLAWANVNEAFIATDTFPQTDVDQLSKADEKNRIKMVLPMLNAVKGMIDGIPIGAKILIFSGTFQSVHPSIIEAISSNYLIFITDEDYSVVKSESESFEERKRITNRIENLLNRINSNVKNSRYRAINFLHKKRDKEYQESGPAMKTLLDLLGWTKNPEVPVCCDDRYINYHRLVGNHPNFGFFELLRAMHRKGALTEGKLYATLNKARASNLRFIPYDTREIVYYLKRTNIENDRVSESIELKTVRRYINSCIDERNYLKRPVLHSDGNLQMQEYEFLMDCRRVVDGSIIAIWKDRDIEHSKKKTLSEWVLESLFIDVAGIREAFGGRATDSELGELYATTISHLIIQSLELNRKSDDRSISLRKSYLDWLNECVLKPANECDTNLLLNATASIVQNVKSSLKDISEKGSEDEQAVQKMIWAEFIFDMPRLLLDKMDLGKDLEASLGIFSDRGYITLGVFEFFADDYFQVLEGAANGKTMEVKERNAGETVLVEKAPSDCAESIPKISFVRKSDGRRYNFSDFAFDILSITRGEIPAFIKRHEHWIDCAPQKIQRLIDDIQEIDSRVERFEKVVRLREGSVSVAYDSLEDLLNKNSEISASDLDPPDWDRVAEHLRIDASLDGAGGQAKIVANLVEELGGFDATKRVSHLPCVYHGHLLEYWNTLPEGDFQTRLSELSEGYCSVVSDINLMQLASLGQSEFATSIAKEKFAYYFDNASSREDFELFVSLLHYAEAKYVDWKDSHRFPAWAKIACIWYHSSRLHALLRRGDCQSINRWIKSITPSWTTEYLNRDTDFWTDISRAKNVKFSHFLFNSIPATIGHSTTFCSDLGASIYAEKYSTSQEDRSALQLEIIQRSSYYSNCLDSYLDRPPNQYIINTYSKEVYESIYLETSIDEAKTYIKNLVEEPTNLKTWALLVACTASGYIPSELRQVFCELVKACDFAELFAIDRRTAGLAFVFSCKQVGAIGDNNLIDHMKKQLLQISRDAQPKIKDLEYKDKKDEIRHLLSAIEYITIVPGDANNGARDFYNLLKDFILTQSWIAEEFKTSPSQWLASKSLSQNIAIWPYLLTIRSIK